MTDYDVIVLGGGSAGSSAAAAATKAGARTLMINEGELGGLCILRGCMPTKTMLASAHAIHEARHMGPLGARLEGRVVPEFDRIMTRKDALVKRFQEAKIRSVESQDYEVAFGRGRFAAGGGVEIDDRKLTARSYVIATGSYPRILPIPGLGDVPMLTSDDVMRLKSPPSSLLVQGAGPIALELAQFFARIGTRVLLVNRSPFLCKVDPECGKELYGALCEEPSLELVVPGTIKELRKRGSGLSATIEGGDGDREFEADALLMAVGRCPSLDDLGLEHIGLEPSEAGLEYDDRMRTSSPGIYVAGDSTGDFQILHLANEEGTVAGHNAAGGESSKRIDYRLRMAVVFTDPVFARVGESELETEARGADYIVGRARLPETGRAITMGVEHGLWKIHADRKTGEILGSVIVGPRADDLIHLVSVMMHYGGTASDILRLPWYHPTLSEIMINIGRNLDTQ